MRAIREGLKASVNASTQNVEQKKISVSNEGGESTTSHSRMDQDGLDLILNLTLPSQIDNLLPSKLREQ